ncbi:BrnA antitoxin family protein [Succinivibrio dextrinosolvens]|uniref:BrnA antitoxin of type II toxin-antitoxin system n=1 Tax=Succinivibrio dextrinosolvens TaxID=83771 RepID=A0A662ZD49_9GAMM|nr:hypothetical protein [Succinivibrio dextrinosolvens]SFK28014.1 hypothetical protein SAMN04487865_10488 [Succinivibrio dextrinosolvens]
MGNIDFKLDPNKKLTKDEIEMLKNAQNLPFEPDEDAPELSPEQIEEFKRIIAERRELSRKKTVSLRISQSTLNIAKSFGSSYTSVLANILENVFRDPKALKKYL